MHKVKTALSLAVLLGTVAVVGLSFSGVAFADEGSRCDCKYTNGDFGVIRDNNCVVENCWLPIE